MSLKFILHSKAFFKTIGISNISFSVNVSNFHLSLIHISSIISSTSLSTFSPEKYILYFHSFITTISWSSRFMNSLVNFDNAFISLAK
ncbi:MAG: hypothetical protein LBQ24_00465 [Candidatus Peribacteria bacterium]|nr:hypothetical protein [Candidatus Peribacteria bacterium]